MSAVSYDKTATNTKDATKYLDYIADKLKWHYYGVRYIFVCDNCTIREVEVSNKPGEYVYYILITTREASRRYKHILYHVRSVDLSII